MAITLVGKFEDYEQAQRARGQLAQAGIGEVAVHLTANDDAGGAGSHSHAREHRGFFARLFGLEEADENTGRMPGAMRRGSALLTVTLADDSQADTVNRILENNGAVAVDERVDQFGVGGHGRHDPAHLQSDLASRYSGPERRMHALPFSGFERRLSH